MIGVYHFFLSIKYHTIFHSISKTINMQPTTQHLIRVDYRQSDLNCFQLPKKLNITNLHSTKYEEH